MQFDQLLQPVIAVNHAAIEIIQIGRGESSAIQRHQRPQLRRNHRNHVENHPFGFISRLDECLNNLQPFRELDFLLLRVFALHPRAELGRQFVDVHTLQQLLNRFGAHHGNEFSGILLLQLAIFFFREKFAFF